MTFVAIIIIITIALCHEVGIVDCLLTRLQLIALGGHLTVRALDLRYDAIRWLVVPGQVLVRYNTMHDYLLRNECLVLVYEFFIAICLEMTMKTD